MLHFPKYSLIWIKLDCSNKLFRVLQWKTDAEPSLYPSIPIILPDLRILGSSSQVMSSLCYCWLKKIPRKHTLLSTQKNMLLSFENWLPNIITFTFLQIGQWKFQWHEREMLFLFSVLWQNGVFLALHKHT